MPGGRYVSIHPMPKHGVFRHGDIVKVYNDRGAVLGIAQVTERIRPGLYTPIRPAPSTIRWSRAKPGSIDKGGCMNLLTPSRMVSKNAPGMANNSCLVEICKWEA